MGAHMPDRDMTPRCENLGAPTVVTTAFDGSLKPSSSFWQLGDPMVVFTNTSSAVRRLRELNCTYIIHVDAKKMAAFWRQLDQAHDHKTPRKLDNAHLVEYRNQHLRTNMLKLAADLNPFLSTFFAFLCKECLNWHSVNRGEILIKAPPLKKLGDRVLVTASKSFGDAGSFVAGTSAAIAKWNHSYSSMAQDWVVDQRYIAPNKWISIAEQACLFNPALCVVIRAGDTRIKPCASALTLLQGGWQARILLSALAPPTPDSTPFAANDGAVADQRNPYKACVFSSGGDRECITIFDCQSSDLPAAHLGALRTAWKKDGGPAVLSDMDSILNQALAVAPTARIQEYIAYEEHVSALLRDVPKENVIWPLWRALAPEQRAATGAVYLGINWRKVTDWPWEAGEEYRETVLPHVIGQLNHTNGIKHFTIFFQSHAGQLRNALYEQYEEGKMLDFTNIVVFATRGNTARPQFAVPLLHDGDSQEDFLVANLSQKKRTVSWSGKCTNVLRCYTAQHIKSLASLRPNRQQMNWTIHTEELAQNPTKCLSKHFTHYTADMRESMWWVALPGTSPSAFSTFEALQANNLLLMLYMTPETLVYAEQEQLSSLGCDTRSILSPSSPGALSLMHPWMPYTDIGVRWSEFSVIGTLEQLPLAFREIEEMPEQEVAARQHTIRWLRKLFTREGAFKYVLWVMHFYKDRSRVDLLRSQCAASRLAWGLDVVDGEKPYLSDAYVEALKAHVERNQLRDNRRHFTDK
jgi:hypothetical protein